MNTLKGKVDISATSANIGPGYDVWAVSLNLKNTFEWESLPNAETLFEFDINLSELTKQTTQENIINLKEKMMTPKNHLLAQSYQNLFKHAHKKVIPLRVHTQLNIPISRGLGSSATAILAGLQIAKEVLYEKYALRYSAEEIFKIAHEIEGHSDNIAAALWGGIVINLPINKTRTKTLKINFQAPVKLIGIIPHYQTSTSESRKVLPQKINLEDVAFQSSRLGAMVHLFEKKEWTQTEIELLKICLSDKIHQPYRLNLLKGAKETFDYWSKLGLWGHYISGSGSTLLGFWPKDQNSQHLDLTKVMREKNIACTQVEFEINDHPPIII